MIKTGERGKEGYGRGYDDSEEGAEGNQKKRGEGTSGEKEGDGKGRKNWAGIKRRNWKQGNSINSKQRIEQ